MPTYVSFTDMPLWKESVQFAAEIYRFCEEGKLKTDFRMKDQLRAAAASISNNIAEGFEYSNKKIFIRFLFYSKGSAGEVSISSQFCTKQILLTINLTNILAAKQWNYRRRSVALFNTLNQNNSLMHPFANP